MKISGNVDDGTRKRWSHFGDDQDFRGGLQPLRAFLELTVGSSFQSRISLSMSFRYITKKIILAVSFLAPGFVQTLQCADFTVIDHDYIDDPICFRVNTNQVDFSPVRGQHFI